MHLTSGRRGRAREYFNLMLTMVLGGIWHGAGILFLLWGAWHGLILCLYRAFPFDKWLAATFGRAGNVIAAVIMFQLVCVGGLLFRADLTTILPLWSSIWALSGAVDLTNFYFYGRGVLVLGLLTLGTDWLGYRRNGEFEDGFEKYGVVLSSLILVICYFAITVLGKRESAQFIYFQF